MSGLPASLNFGPPPGRQPAMGKGSPGGHKGGRARAAKGTDAETWQAEYERMKGNLVITVPAESHNEWHSDLERGGATLQSLRAAAAGTRGALEDMGQGLTAKLQRLASLEGGLNRELQGTHEELAGLDQQLQELQAQHDGLQEYVGELHKELAFLNAELEARRRQLEETGDTLSSGKPAAVLRAAVAALRGELVQMDVRTGMLQHLLLQRSCESQ